MEVDAGGGIVVGFDKELRVDELDANVFAFELAANVVKRRHRWQRSGVGLVLGGRG